MPTVVRRPIFSQELIATSLSGADSWHLGDPPFFSSLAFEQFPLLVISAAWRAICCIASAKLIVRPVSRASRFFCSIL